MHRIFLGWEEKLAISGKGNNYQNHKTFQLFFSLFIHTSINGKNVGRKSRNYTGRSVQWKSYTTLSQAMETESFYDYEKPN